jgi:uncharacterized protein YjiS (DUF1127 family)
MSARSTDISVPQGELRHRLDMFFAGLGQGFNAYLEGRSRLREFEALNAKSNEQLNAMGLKREDIARYLFRDLMTY